VYRRAASALRRDWCGTGPPGAPTPPPRSYTPTPNMLPPSTRPRDELGLPKFHVPAPRNSTAAALLSLTPQSARSMDAQPKPLHPNGPTVRYRRNGSSTCTPELTRDDWQPWHLMSSNMAPYDADNSPIIDLESASLGPSRRAKGPPPTMFRVIAVRTLPAWSPLPLDGLAATSGRCSGRGHHAARHAHQAACGAGHAHQGGPLAPLRNIPWLFVGPKIQPPGDIGVRTVQSSAHTLPRPDLPRLDGRRVSNPPGLRSP